MAGAVTIAAVAAAAGVSKATASKVLSDQTRRYHVAETTRQRVQLAAQQLGYSWDWRAASRARRRSRHVGLLFEWLAPFTDGAYEHALSSAAEVLGEQGYDLLLVPSIRSLEDWGRQRHDQRIDGIIVMQPTDNSMRMICSGAGPGLPTVVLNQCGDYPVDQILCDDAMGMRQAVGHLLERGYRRIALLVGSPGDEHYSKVTRRAVFHQALAEAGLAAAAMADDPATLFASAAGGIDAVITYDHRSAHAVLHHLYGMPNRPAVIAGTDIGAWELTTPHLTAIDVGMSGMMAAACRLLLQRIAGQGPDRPARLAMPQNLVVRDSTPPVPRLRPVAGRSRRAAPVRREPGPDAARSSTVRQGSNRPQSPPVRRSGRARR